MVLPSNVLLHDIFGCLCHALVTSDKPVRVGGPLNLVLPREVHSKERASDGHDGLQGISSFRDEMHPGD